MNPNIIILIIFIQKKFNLNNFMNYIKDTKIKNLYINIDKIKFKNNIR